MRKRGYKTKRPSRKQRTELWNFYKEIYTVANKKTPANQAAKSEQITFTDKDGNEQVLGAVTAYEDTDWYADNATLYPQLDEACLANDDAQFDAEGRPNLLNTNLIVVDATHMTKGEYGPWYLLHVIAEGKGEFSLPTRGQVFNELIEGVSGLELATGRRVNPSELPIAVRIEFVQDGDFNGYYVPKQPIKSADAVEVEA